MAVPMVSSAEGVPFVGFKLVVVTWQAWHFVTFKRGRRNILLRCFQKMGCISRGRHSTLDVSIVILPGRRSTLDVSCCMFFQIALAGLRQVATRCKFRGRRGIWCDVLKIDGSLAQNINFEIAKVDVPEKTRRKTSILMLQSVKSGGSPTCLVSSLWFSGGFAVSMGEAAKHLLFEGFQAGCHVVLGGGRGTLWHSNLFDAVSKMSKLEEVSHEMLILLLPRASSRVSGFPVASPCLWGKLQNLSFLLKVCKHVVLSFCVAGVAHCDIPTCFIPCRKFFVWLAQQCTPHFTLYTLHSSLYTPHSTLHTLHFPLHTPHSILYTPHFTLHNLHFRLLTPHFTLQTLHSTLYTPHSTLYTLHSTLHTPPRSTLYTLLTPHFTLHTPHFPLHTLNSTLYTPHSALYTYTPHSKFSL